MQINLQAKLDSIVLRSVTRDFFPHAVITSKEEYITIMEVETTAEDLVSYTELMNMICPPDIYIAVIGEDPDEPAFISYRYGDIEEMTVEQFEEDTEVFRLVIKPHSLPSEDDSVDSTPEDDSDWDWV